MSGAAGLTCPACGGALGARAGSEIACSSCARRFAILHRDGENFADEGVIDLRMQSARATVPWPLERGDLDGALERAASGMDYRATLEELLLELPEPRAERLMLRLREAGGAWFPLLRTSGGELLFIGNALSGTVTPLTDAGFRVTVLDPCEERVRFARVRNRTHSPGRTVHLLGGDSERLPFADGAFDVVVQEDGLPGARRSGSSRDRGRSTTAGLFAHDLSECCRVARGEVVLVADNRLGYKRSSGRRGDFHVPGPFEYVSAALAPERGERTLRGYRRVFVQAGCDRVRAFALYPHSQDFSHVVALDEPTPALTIGPMERKNRLKLAARAIGLFPVLTPSFALIGEPTRTPNAARETRPGDPKEGTLPSSRLSQSARPLRIERILAELAQHIGEPAPKIEQLVSTRGNTAIVHTSIPGAAASDASGRWTLHLPLAPKNIPQCERHYRMLELLRSRFPSVPVPEPLFIGRADGVSVTCERRAQGSTAPQRVGDLRCIARMLRDTAEHFSKLVVRSAEPFTDEDFAEQVTARFDLAARHAAVPDTIANLTRLHDEMRERLIGKKIARVIYHADMRAKHVQIDADGRVTAYLDWGTAEPVGLPYQDLLQLLAHEKKQEAGLTPAAAWGLVRERERLRDYEREALASYAQAVGLDDETCVAFEHMYPVLVAAMAEKNWDYSRPRWLHKQFGL